MAAVDALITAALKTPFSKAAALIGTRRGINFIDGSGITTTVADNPANDRVDVTITSAAVGAMTLILDYTAPSVLGSFDTNVLLGGNIPQTYKDLILLLHVQSNFGAAASSVAGRINGASANYFYNFVQGNSTTVTGAAATGISSGYFGVSNANIGAGRSPVRIEFPNYAVVNGGSNPTYLFQSSCIGDGSATNAYAVSGGGYGGGVAPVTRLELFPSGGSWLAGSRFTLYGTS